MATVDTLQAPKVFKVKDKEHGQLLIDFDTYMKTADCTKLTIPQAIGGPDMADLVEMVGKVQLEAMAADPPNWILLTGCWQ